ncbi:MAG: AEC family transporter [Deltaproteobacteria bacterium]|nr:MAG: AEC family transporter [Deltaproteobacteria bacterium]
MNIFTTIIPIFTIILLGWISRKKGFIHADFIGPANSLVFYIAIPAMIFSAISRATLTAHFNVGILVITLSTAMVACVFAWVFGRACRLKQGQLGSYVQISFHGNLGYIGLAVAFYYLGEDGFVKASILTGFLMIVQNLLSVLSLTFNAHQPDSARHGRTIVRNLVGNPVILSAMAGIVCSFLKVPIPLIIQRSLGILSGLALPMALLIIGASISFQETRHRVKWVLSSSTTKLFLMPGLGYIAFRSLGFPPGEYLPGLILLASPSATISYVMAKEMKGDPDLAVIAISFSTLLSALTYTFWLNVAV